MRIYLSTSTLQKLWPHANPRLLEGIARESTATLSQFGIDTIPDLVDFISECSEETGGMIALTEDLDYSAERAHQIWPREFPTVEIAAQFTGSPKLLADKVYGGQLGNRPGTDDGYNFRGRGAIQLTGRGWYEKIGKAIGFDLVDNPDIVVDPRYVLQCAAAFWKIDGVNNLAKAGEWNAEVKRINGGYTNMAQRLAWRKIVATHLIAGVVSAPTQPVVADDIKSSGTFEAEIVRAKPSSASTQGVTMKSSGEARETLIQTSPVAEAQIDEIHDRLHRVAQTDPHHPHLLQDILDRIENWGRSWSSPGG